MPKSIRELEVELARIEAMHTSAHWELLQARSAKLKENQAFAAAVEKAACKRRGELVDEPIDPTARAILAAGRKARGEIQ
jgi:hypothetical protein